ncbi:MAG TPA: hypothetical protein DCM87_18980, partial [Planctomycetes bacterium]|nr:hypothetical protein [Planctomycetota bacterium]
DAESLADYIGQPLTICLGVGRDAAGTQSHFDNVSLSVAQTRCPFALRASSGDDGVTLAWENGTEIPISVRILRDTVEIASAAPVDPATYLDTGAPPGLIEYKLIFTMPGDACGSLAAIVDTCIRDLAATRTEAGVVLTWTNKLTYDGIEIRRDGEVLEASLGGAIETYTDATPAVDGIVTYSVVPVHGTCNAAAVEVDMTLVRNAGFEDPRLADGDWITGGTHWNTGSYDAADRTVWIPGWDDAGVWNPDAADGFSGSAAFAGQNTGWVISWAQYDGGLSQVLFARFEADTEYVLSAQVGNAFYNGSDATAPYRLELWAGDVLLASETGAAPAADTWELKSLTYASGPDPVGLGLPLEIRLVAAAYVDGSGIDGYEVDFDDVRLAITGVPEERFRFKRGDANADGKRDIADAIKVLGYLFGGGTTQLGCLDAGDANDDGKVDIADAIKILGYLFASAGPLPDPFDECGEDPTDTDPLDCQLYEPCGTGV